jgi:hypothetical protein
MIYWTKYKSVYNEETDTNIMTNELEIIKESDEDFVTDGDGFEVNMNGISYEEYLEDTSLYVIERGVLNRTPLEMESE